MMFAMLYPIALLQAVSAQTQTQAQPPPPPAPGCTGAEFSAFDFWVGEWDDYPTGRETLVAHSRIEKLYGGCAVRENWMPLKGPGGGSLNGFNPQTGNWQQFWIGASPGPVEFIGGPSPEGGLVMTGYWIDFDGRGRTAMVRQTYSVLDSGAVRQHGEASFDHGLTWATRYDFTYRRHRDPLA